MTNRTKLTILDDVNTCELMRKIDLPDTGFIFPADSVYQVIDTAIKFSEDTNDVAMTHEVDTISISAKCSLTDCKARAALIENLAAYIHDLVEMEEIRLIEKFLSNTFGTEVLIQTVLIDTFTAHVYFSYELPFSQYAFLADMLKSKTRQFNGDVTILDNLEVLTLEYTLDFQNFDGLNNLLPSAWKSIFDDVDKLKTVIAEVIRYNLNLD